MSTRVSVGDAGPTGVKWPNYVNGRLLTAQDLSAEQSAVLVRDRWLGQAIGSGIAEGLEVSGLAGSSVLQVSPGTGVCPGGAAVHLDAPATLDLAAVVSATPVDGALFAACAPESTTTKAPSAGAYLLVMRPASSYEGKVPVQGAPTATLTTPCTSRWQVEKVLFVAIRLDGFTVATTADNRRNLLAHYCFGSGELAELAMSGFAEPSPYRGFDGIADISECDLPLAVFDWDGQGLVFVDAWSARRRPVHPSAAVRLGALVDDGRTADGEARLLQFQDQLDGLLATPAGQSVRAIDVFALLPPAGLVPIDPLAAAEALVNLGDDDAPGPPSSDPAVPPGAGQTQQPGKTAFNTLLLKRRGTEGITAGTGLGALSQRLLLMQQDIDALRNTVEDLQAAVTGGGRGSSAGERESRRQLINRLVELLADTAGTGVDPARFFAGIRVRVGVVDRETVDFTIRRSWCDEPVDLGSGPVLNVFFVAAPDGESVAPYVLFSKRINGIRWIGLKPRVVGG